MASCAVVIFCMRMGLDSLMLLFYRKKGYKSAQRNLRFGAFDSYTMLFYSQKNNMIKKKKKTCIIPVC